MSVPIYSIYSYPFDIFDIIYYSEIMRNGFSLIELMVVVVIIGILAAIGVYQYTKTLNKAKIVSLEANMHSFQISLELYATDKNGDYPFNSDTSGLGKYLLKNIKNPFSNGSDWITNSDPAKLGQVYFWSNLSGTHYKIKGMGPKGYINLEYDR